MVSIEMQKPVLFCERLTKVFSDGDQKIVGVKEAFFSIKKGEFVCLRGPSGSGKSTFLKLLAGIELPSSGEVYFLGTPYGRLGSFGVGSLRRRFIGVVLQELALINYFTAVENVELPSLFAGFDPKVSRSEALKTLEIVGLKNRSHHLPIKMSAGERQRTAIARALLTQPVFLIADEPSSSLDSDNTKQVVDIFIRLAQEGVAVLVATHDDRILTRAHRVVHMQDGFLQESPTG